MKDKIIEILKDHALLRTDGVHAVYIRGVYPELFEKVADYIIDSMPSAEKVLIDFKDWHNADDRNEYHLNIGEIKSFLLSQHDKS